MSDIVRNGNRAIAQYEALHWAWTVCKEEDDPAAVIQNMLNIISKGDPQDFPAIIEERRRRLK